jgi:hypothetical protein
MEEPLHMRKPSVLNNPGGKRNQHKKNSCLSFLPILRTNRL